MTKYIYLLILFVNVLISKSVAQYRDGERTLLLKADVLTLVNEFTFPLAQVSLEKRLSKDFSISPELGIQPFGVRPSKLDTTLVKWNGFRVGVEGRYYGLFKSRKQYYRPNRPSAEKYISLNVFYRQNQYNSRVSYEKPNDTTMYSDCFAVNKKAWGINAIFGIQLTKNRFVAEFYGGIGFLSRQIKNKFREYDHNTDEIDHDIDITVNNIKRSSSLAENSGVIGNVVLGIRMGLKL